MIPRTTQRSRVLVDTPCFSATFRHGARCLRFRFSEVVSASPPLSVYPSMGNMIGRLVRVNRHCAHRHQRARTATPRKSLKN